MTLFHTAFIFLIVLDPLGNIPLFVSVLKAFDAQRQRKIILREMLIALVVLFAFLFFGQAFFNLLDISNSSLQIAGGVILFLIAIRMLISVPEKEKKAPLKEPLIVPLAIPAVAGPGILATISLYGGGVESTKFEVILAILIAWGITLPILLLSSFLKRILGNNGLVTIERLFGYLLILISVEMVLQGIHAFIKRV